MKLVDLLKYISSDVDIKVLTYNYATEEEEENEIYKGDIFDVPWHIAELALDNEGEGAIYTDTKTGELLIYVSE